MLDSKLVVPSTEQNDAEKASTELSLNKTCENCHQPLSGPFCGRCGQEAESTLKYFWLVILHLLDDIFSFDSRASRTLWPLLMRPAFLTKEYFVGRRVHYVPPLRLYLFISIVFFLTLKFFVDVNDISTLNLKNNEIAITKIEKHIKVLEDKQLLLQQQSPENNEAIKILQDKLVRFNKYSADLNSDSKQANSQQIIKITQELINFELNKATDEKTLSEDDKQHIELLLQDLLKVKSGQQLEQVKNSFNISNNGDGKMTFEFLSDESNKKLDDFTKQLSKKAEKAFTSDVGPLIQQVIGKLPQLMFILLPLFALLLKLMFISSNKFYMEHLTVALHSHSFIFFTILVIELLGVFHDYAETSFPMVATILALLTGALVIWLPIYLFIMQKRVYNQGYFFTLVKYTIISSVYLMMIVATGLVAIVWGLTSI